MRSYLASLTGWSNHKGHPLGVRVLKALCIHGAFGIFALELLVAWVGVHELVAWLDAHQAPKIGEVLAAGGVYLEHSPPR